MNTARMRRRLFAPLAWLGVAAAVHAAGPAADVTTPDPGLKAVVIDSAPTESFLGVRVDTTGRIFVGGRTAVFVLEPDASGGYAPRRELVRFPDDTWVHDIEIRGDDLYVLTVSALYVIPGGRVKREGLEVRRLVWGVPRGHTHQCFHGMTLGPEGDLYVGVGDPLWYYGDFKRADHLGHWTFFGRRPGDTSASPAADAWERMPYTGVGAVLRCRPDGSGLRVVAGGLRNDCGLAFDRDWNLFTADNDHESQPADYVPGRLLHVTPRAWFSWPRGWSPDKTPERLDLLATMNPALGRFVPVGQAFYDDAFLPEQYRNSLLVARWCTRQVAFYPLEHAGASFRCREGELLAGGGVARPVNVTVGRGGRVFATVCHMEHNEDSPVYRSDLVMVTTAADPAARPFAAYDAPAAGLDRLFAELADPSWSRRKEAHEELLRRDVPASEFVGRWDGSAVTRSYDREHLLWLVGLRADASTARDRLVKVLDDTVPSIRLQAVRCLAERFPGEVRDLLPLLAADPGPQVRHAVVLACFGAPGLGDDDSVVAAILDGPARSDDTYLRQAATLLLARWCPSERLAAWMDSADPLVRRAAVLAAGFRLTLPDPVSTPAENLPLAPWIAADRSCVVRYADATIDLRSLGRLGTFTSAEHWKAAPHSAEQERLFEILAGRLADADESIRLQAAAFLRLLADPRSEPKVMALREGFERRKAEWIAAIAAAAPKPGEFLDPNRPAWDPAAFTDVDWAAEARKGDAARGRQLFGAGGVGCAKCHAVDDASPVAGGPSLAAAGRRFTLAYLAESVLQPGKVVAPLFRATTVITTDGRSITGLAAGETAESLELILPDASRVTIPLAEIEERVVQPVSPMPEGLVRTREELRDLLAYLANPAAADAMDSAR
ncbi:MAG: hypothetical protein ACKOZU_00385 [Planctomycetaceae bacterium]